MNIYLYIFKENESPEFYVISAIEMLKDIWDEKGSKNSTGFIHVGLVKPRIIKPSCLFDFKGKVLVSASAKWSLPSFYMSSQSIIGDIELNGQLTPLHLILKGLNYNAQEPITSKELKVNHKVVNEQPLLEVILQVLNKSKAPLNKKVYTLILWLKIFTILLKMILSWQLKKS